MNKYTNYYEVLELENTCSKIDIKKSYRKLSFKYHPDKNKGNEEKFEEINKAYTILYDDELREEYDKKSKWGQYYDETLEFFDIDINFDYDSMKMQRETFKKNYVNNIRIEVDDSFDGTLEYERYILCKTCDGSGKDLSSKIVIRDKDGNITKVFEGDTGCDYCEGSGKDYRNKTCSFCDGKGKIGITECKTCNGSKRILGKQKLKNIKLTGDETKINHMGHYSINGNTGYLLVVKIKEEN